MAITSRVYLDNAATTPVHAEVIDEITSVMREYYGNPSSIYTEGQKSKELLERSRDIVASSINAEGREIFFTASGTESDNWAIKGAALRYFGQKMHIITSRIEHHAVLHTCESLAKLGYDITYLPVDEDGIVSPEALAAAIRPDTAIVSIMMANNEIGTIQPIKELASVCREKKVLFHTDAVQAAGSLPIDIIDLGVDMLSLSGHKFGAPKGIGALYIRKGVRINNFMDGGGQERNRRAGTENLPYIAGFAKAITISMADLQIKADKLTQLRNELIEKVMNTIPHTRLNGSYEHRLPGNANFSFEFIEGESLLLMLDHMGFACSSGSACTSGSLDPSHVLLSIGLPHEIAHGSLRVSIGTSLTSEIIDQFVVSLEQIVMRLRQMSPLYEDFIKNKTTPIIPCTKCYKEQIMKEV
ncbi:MAG: cysteine desulfurase NifS [Clostridiaceae bacterium]|nr:cysteine desulfurase NifS [Clostridiaceae bacterium]